MNIFFVDRDPRKAAEALRDNHIIKMPSESGQLLSAWADVEGWEIKGIPIPQFEVMDYPASVPNHPCRLWLSEGLENVLWLIRHLRAMHQEYDHRYGGKDKYLKSRAMVEVLEPWLTTMFVFRNWTPPKQALGPNAHLYEVLPYTTDNAVQAYRRYYTAEKLPDATYKTQPPEWKPYEPPPPPKEKIKANQIKLTPKATPGVNAVVHNRSSIATLRIKRKD